MRDTDLKDRLMSLFSEPEGPIKASKPPGPSVVADEKRQQDRSRTEVQPGEEDHLAVSSPAKSKGGMQVDEATRPRRSELSGMTALPQHVNAPSQGMELRQCLQIAREWWWLIVACTLLGATSAFLVSFWMTPIYSASLTLLVDLAPATGINEYSAILASERLVGTYGEMLKGRALLEAVVARLELEETPAALAERVEVETVRDTQLIRLGVEDAIPARAALIANTIAETFISQIQALQSERYASSLTSMQEQIIELSALIKETQTAVEALGTPGTAEERADLTRLETILAGYRNTHATLQQNYELTRLAAAQSTHNVIVVEAAEVPEKPVRPRTFFNTALAAVVGAMLAVGIAFLVEYLDDTIKTSEDVSHALGLDTLGIIGRPANGEESLIVATRPLSPAAETFRVLCTNLRSWGVDKSLRTLLVTSPSSAEGKSGVMANLAVVMAQAGLSVVAVDADLRHPRLHQLFDLDLTKGGRGWWGLTGALHMGRAESWLQSTQMKGLRILPSGRLPPNPVQMVNSERMQKLLDELAQRANVVLIDSPAVLPAADATVLAQAVDGVLLVLGAGKTRREDAWRAVERLRRVGANLVGVVLNAVPTRSGSD